jgi:DNA mismatch repair protein MutH
MSKEYNLSAGKGYDKFSIESIFEYSQRLLGKSLREALEDEVMTDSAKDGLHKRVADDTDIDFQKHNKGGFGQMIEELYFKYHPNSNPGPDFKEAGMELKATGLKKLKKTGEYQIKERLVCDIINYEEVVNQTFEDSTFYRKCRIMLILFYLYQKNTNNWDLKFIYSVVWKMSAKDLDIIEHDFYTIVAKIKAGKAHLLSEGDTEYLGACRKGNKDTGLRPQPYSDIRAPQRAFSLKPAYMRTVLEYIRSSGKRAASNFDISTEERGLVSAEELKHQSFEDIILSRFRPFIGLNYMEICSKLGMEPTKAKQKFAIVANAIATKGFAIKGLKQIDDSEEFQKSGIRLKTVRQNANGKVEQCMAFENIDYQEIYDNDSWIDSRLYEIFTNRFLFVVFHQPEGQLVKNKNADQYILTDVFFWTMPAHDIEIAKEYWENIRQQVLKNRISLDNFWHMADDRLFHVRPKAQKATDRTANPNGGEAPKYCYWFNSSYTEDIIASQHKKNG